MKRFIYLLVPLALFLSTTAFDCDPPPPPPPPSGFVIYTSNQLVVNGVPTPSVPSPSVFVNAEFLVANGTSIGTQTDCIGVTDASGHYPCPDRIVPASWALTEHSGECAGQTVVNNEILPGGTLTGNCVIHVVQFLVSPASFNINAPPVMIDITGEGMTGMPVIHIVNNFGYVVASTTATQCNGNWLQAPLPYLGFLYSDSYTAVVYNVAPDGHLIAVGGAWMDLFGNDPPPPPPPDPCFPEIQLRMPVYPCLPQV